MNPLWGVVWFFSGMVIVCAVAAVTKFRNNQRRYRRGF